MKQDLVTIEDFHDFIVSHDLAVIHVMRDRCSVCRAVLPQIEGLVNDFPQVALGVINQSHLEAIASELSIYTAPVDLIYLKGKEMHRQGRFIYMQQFEHQLELLTYNGDYS